VPPVKYELGFYIPEDDILHSHCRENLKSYSVKTICKEVIVACLSTSTRLAEGTKESSNYLSKRIRCRRVNISLELYLWA
jgi:hypothetical protein